MNNLKIKGSREASKYVATRREINSSRYVKLAEHPDEKFNKAKEKFKREVKY